MADPLLPAASMAEHLARRHGVGIATLHAYDRRKTMVAVRRAVIREMARLGYRQCHIARAIARQKDTVRHHLEASHD